MELDDDVSGYLGLCDSVTGCLGLDDVFSWLFR